MGRNRLNGRGKLDPKVRFQVIPDNETPKFLVWDTRRARYVKKCNTRLEAEQIRDKKNNVK